VSGVQQLVIVHSLKMVIVEVVLLHRRMLLLEQLAVVIVHLLLLLLCQLKHVVGVDGFWQRLGAVMKSTPHSVVARRHDDFTHWEALCPNKKVLKFNFRDKSTGTLSKFSDILQSLHFFVPQD
jgi:hypothetical protein